jgi:hypothetical protein
MQSDNDEFEKLSFDERNKRTETKNKKMNEAIEHNKMHINIYDN